MPALPRDLGGADRTELGPSQSAVKEHAQNRVVHRARARMLIRQSEHPNDFLVTQALSLGDAPRIQKSDILGRIARQLPILHKPVEEALERRQVPVNGGVLKAFLKQLIFVTDNDRSLE